MNLHGLADELLEVRRYVRSNPEHVKERINALDFLTGKGLGCDFDTPRTKGVRYRQNLLAGLERIVVNPEILEGYLYGAAAEIREMARRQEDAK